jgi:hypothetical protein
MELSDEGDELVVARPRALSCQQWYLPSHFTLLRLIQTQPPVLALVNPFQVKRHRPRQYLL